MKPIKKQIVIIIALLFIISTMIVGLVVDITQGWTNEKIVSYAFSIIVFIGGISMYSPIHEYVLSNDKKMIKSNNSLFRCFEEAERNGTLLKYKECLDDEERKPLLDKVDIFLASFNKDYEPMNYSSFCIFINEKRYLEKPYKLSKDELAQLFIYKIELDDAYSAEFEELYRQYKTKEMICRHPFPVFNVLLPFIVSLIGLLATIYQFLTIGASLNTSIFTYIAVLLEIAAIGSLVTWRLADKEIDLNIEKNKQIIKTISALNGNNQ